MPALRLFALLLAFVPGPAVAQGQVLLEAALARALDTFEQALPALAPEEMGVDVGQYREALTWNRFASTYWGGAVRLDIATQPEAGGSCSRFAAFVEIPPRDGAVRLVLCPQFFTPGADALRELTVLHEMVHVVAGPDECRAMAFAARVQMAATGTFTPVDLYWRASSCAGSEFRLPK